MPEAYRFNGDAAVNYDHYLGPFLFEPFAIHMAGQIPVAGVEKVLEIASGTGRVTMHLRKHFPESVQLVATDISKDMLTVAADRLKYMNVDFREADALNLPFDDNTFDVIVCQYGVMFFPDRQKGINEAYRVLKPGGRFLFSTWDKSANMPVMKTIIDDTVVPFFGNEDLTRFRVPFSMHNTDELKILLKNSGFSSYEAEQVTLIGNAPSAQNLVEGLFLKHPLGSEVADKDPSVVDSMALSMTNLLKERFGTGSISGELSAFFARGIK